MDKNKQIEEIKNILLASTPVIDMPFECFGAVARAIYNAGYRKQSDTAREILIYLYEKIGNVAVSDSELIKYLAKEYGVEVEE